MADFFLLAIKAIGRQEIHDGTLGSENIKPIDIMAFFVSLAYIALSIDASGLIRLLALKILQRGGKNGRRLFLYLYIFFFLLAGIIGNDPIVLSGTPFLAYMTRLSSNIEHARAWIFTQFAVANIASAILVSSNPTNLVLAGAFEIKFINYTANMIVPVAVTAVMLFPLLLWVIFREQKLIPSRISLHELPQERKNKASINPNIPQPRDFTPSYHGDTKDDEQKNLDFLEEVMNPFVDKPSAIFSSSIMIVTLVVILAINATAPRGEEHPVFWISVPAAVVVLCWDLAMGWRNRHATRSIARGLSTPATKASAETQSRILSDTTSRKDNLQDAGRPNDLSEHPDKIMPEYQEVSESKTCPAKDEPKATDVSQPAGLRTSPMTLQSITSDCHRWLRETFPTAMTTLSNLPLKLVPFALCMFVLVQALATSGWIPVSVTFKEPMPSAYIALGLCIWLEPLDKRHWNGRRYWGHGLYFSHPLQRKYNPFLSENSHHTHICHSSQVPTLARPFCFAESSKPGCRSVVEVKIPFPSGPSGPPCTAWLSASTTEPLALH